LEDKKQEGRVSGQGGDPGGAIVKFTLLRAGPDRLRELVEVEDPIALLCQDLPRY